MPGGRYVGHTSQLLTGLAELMESSGLGVFRPDGVYGDGEVGIFLHRLPESPDRAIALTPYPVEDTDLTDAITGVQIRIREGPDPRVISDTADAVFDVLHNRRGDVFGTVYVALIWRQSQAPMGQDPHGREELVSNYYARTTRPSPHLYE